MMKCKYCSSSPEINFTFCAVVLSAIYIVILADCPVPEKSIRNGRIIYERFDDKNLTTVPENYIFRFRCYKGYVRIGPQVIICQKDGWSDNVPECAFLECPEPPPISNGYHRGDRRAVGSTVQYNCSPGFEISNPNASVLTCFLNDTSYLEWAGEMPECIEKRQCSDPGTSSNGFRVGSCCFTGASLAYSCNDGYELVGTREITCLKGAFWSSERPRCRPLDGHCPDPPAIGNGVVKSYTEDDFSTPYEEVEVVCDSGFSFLGETQYIMCLDDFEWESDFGECIETNCELPEVPANGSIVELEVNNAISFPHQFELTYACNDGFRLAGNVYRTCEKGNWSLPEPRCEEIKCYNPGRPEYGNRNGDDFGIGQKVTFSCFRGYVLIGSVERYCMPNGQWSGELTRCDLESNFCPDPGIPINGRRIGSSFNDGDTIRFRCYPGFTLVGSEVRECQSNRQWSGAEARCLGANDFDNAVDVADTLKVAVNNKAETQAEETSKYVAGLRTLGRAVDGSEMYSFQAQRILDLNFPGRLILYFVFDVSGSVKEQNFKTSINFAKALVKRVVISENGARAGALTFSSKAEIEFIPVQYKTTDEVLDALDKIEYKKGGTATSSALKLVLEEAMPLTRKVLGRIGLKSVVFMLTDGKVNTGGNPEEQAKKLKEAGVEIYCIGITGDIVKNTLYRIASEPSNEHVFILNSYQVMEWLVQEITNGTIDYSECGLGLDKVGQRQNSRVVGGIKVVEPWPWITALYISDKGPYDAELKCGGTIISRKWILTAAHCLCIGKTKVQRNIQQVTMKVGLTDVDNSTYLQEFEASKFIVHGKYNPNNFDNDIALVELNGFIQYNAYVRPICLPGKVIPPASSLYKPTENAFAAGWGYDKVVRAGEIINVPALRNLKELLLPIQSRERCMNRLLDSKGSEHMFTEKMLCAGTGKGGGDTCQGDSGGPLMQSQINKDGNVFWTQVGIVSWGIGCGLENTYGFYTHVHKLINWVNSKINFNVEE